MYQARARLSSKHGRTSRMPSAGERFPSRRYGAGAADAGRSQMGADSITGIVLIAWHRPQRGVRGVSSFVVMRRCGGNGLTYGDLPSVLGGSGLPAISGEAVWSSSADGDFNMGTLPPQSELFSPIICARRETALWCFLNV